ncbi:MAG: pseudouridine-5'-phosphate glycosidase [Gemmatimonadetes bacterium]|nr:pseudouridine-5'-phosphate glycosidase [Gemmatimonadota bacterium]
MAALRGVPPDGDVSGTVPGVPHPITCGAEVADACAAGRPLVTLESSVLAQGLPIPANREAAVVRGVPTIGLGGDDLERFLARDGVTKLSSRDLAPAMVRGRDGATTVAASLTLAAAAGLEVFATGGIGGVHREPAYDESADLLALATAPVITVCAGAKSILDLPGTLERLDSYGVTVLGYRTDEFPGFFTAHTGLRVPQRIDEAAEIAAIFRASRALGRRSALLVVQPPPADAALEAEVVEQAVAQALVEARTVGVRGATVTPFLLAAVERATAGRSLAANLALLEANAALAAEIAVALGATR